MFYILVLIERDSHETNEKKQMSEKHQYAVYTVHVSAFLDRKIYRSYVFLLSKLN